MPQLTRRTVALWCATCRAYVDYDGRVCEAGDKAPVYVAPDLLRAHRDTHEAAA